MIHAFKVQKGDWSQGLSFEIDNDTDDIALTDGVDEVKVRDKMRGKRRILVIKIDRVIIYRENE